MIKEYKLPEGKMFEGRAGAIYQPMSEAAHVDDVSLTLCTAGAAIVEIDMQTYELMPRTEMILMPGSLVRVISCTPDFRATVLVLSPQFVFNMGMRLNPDFIKFMKFNPVADTKEVGFDLQAQSFYTLAMCVCGQRGSRNSVEKMRHLVQFYLLKISDETNGNWSGAAQTQTDRQTELFRKFITLVHDNASAQHDVEWYAARMAITPRYLSLLCKAKRTTPKAVIDEIIIHSAKEMLHSTSLTVQEIASELNFADQSVFARFFKRKTGDSPITWKRKARG